MAKDVVVRAVVLGLFAGGLLKPSRCSYKTWSYYKVYRRGAAMMTPGLALDMVFSPRKIIRALLKDEC